MVDHRGCLQVMEETKFGGCKQSAKETAKENVHFCAGIYRIFQPQTQGLKSVACHKGDAFLHLAVDLGKAAELTLHAVGRVQYLRKQISTDKVKIRNHLHQHIA
ncbi:hypothetical protein SDC9_115107 [bioreactor metagenome]|uniref:Uncharacterized protein n=1 Tax=bioreactor metagenome TaxID=1076179 RepID=A0A645BS28_9ZZZZ